MSKRLPRLDELDLSSFDDYENMQTGTWDKAAGAVRRRSGTGEGLPLFGGIADQCGTCHRRMEDCPWQVTCWEIHEMPAPARKAAYEQLGSHP